MGTQEIRRWRIQVERRADRLFNLVPLLIPDFPEFHIPTCAGGSKFSRLGCDTTFQANPRRRPQPTP
jgi:hypothetical protein